MTREFHEVNGTEWFLPVRSVSLSDRSAEIKYTDIYGQTHCEVVPEIYKFKKGPEKPVIPQLVAEWIETYKKQGKTLYTVMDAVHYSNHPCKDWFESNQETFARAWLDGYEVEKEKIYIVTDGNHCYFEGWDDVRAIVILDDMVGYKDCVKKFDSKTEAEKVAEQLGWKVEIEEVG
ncbi:DUF1642 domain-containing protein [Streptococcus anginosus]|uniref:DUF1642 domain-containing protein n=1 Tax=Streptococcus anginosus TaxID=1328 RepID=UPI002000DF2D|nr:DUF1642 domain-containing protein [Streptococcus anginosus]